MGSPLRDIALIGMLALSACGGEPPPLPDDREEAARELFRRANEAAEAGHYEEAKALMARRKVDFGDTAQVTGGCPMSPGPEIVGLEAGDLEVDRWYDDGYASFDDGQATLLVFFETWCPHCNDLMPDMEALHLAYGDKGLTVAGLTTVTRQASDETVRTFILEHGITFPVGRELDGSMSTRFGVQGIPAAAVVRDGTIVWRGHPARISEDLLQEWLREPECPRNSGCIPVYAAEDPSGSGPP